LNAEGLSHRPQLLQELDANPALYGPAGNVLVEPMGEAWGVYSPLSGQTHLINEASLAVLEALQELGPVSVSGLCEALSNGTASEASDLTVPVQTALHTFLAAGVAQVTAP
jgi:PqqD family protein of HPr-rel-A system